MRWKIVFAVGLVVSAGCGADQFTTAARSGAQEAAYPAAAQASAARDGADGVASELRKIIYEATIRLVVSDFAATERAVGRIVKEHGGYLAEMEIDRHSGKQRSGQWRARVPIDRYDAFLEAIVELGVPTSRRQTAQDVTEEFVDLEARIATKKQLEARIIELLAKSAGKITEVIEVERELARVRSEIEQMEGRLRYLTNRTELTTVTISAREDQDYVPPQSPTFVARVGAAWSQSLMTLSNVGISGTISAVYLAPWMVVAAVLLVPLVYFARSRRRRKALG